MAVSSSKPAAAAVGDVLAGKYRIERVVGEGGMGVVVAARHLTLDRLVALKLVAPDVADDKVVAERFLREARAAAKLKSEHAAKVLDVGRLESGAPYMVMELLEGADLAHVLADDGPLSVETACDYIVQACEAVAEAHANGIVHRDLKPENLFLTRRVGGASLVKVLDFGISKLVSSEVGALTQTSTVMGSPLYMAPEQMRSSRKADPRSDVWSLGVVLYELLTGRLPFEAESLPDLCVRVVQEPPRPVTDFRPDLPPALVRVIQRCLAKAPEDRHPHAADLASALEEFVPSPTRLAAEHARRAMSSLTETQVAEVIASEPAVRATTAPGRARRGAAWLAIAGAGLALALGAGALARGPASAALALAAVQAAITAPGIAPASARPQAGASTAPSPAAAAGTVSLVAPAEPAATTPAAPVFGRSVPVRRPLPARSRPADDDIPAFR